ncbi:MAG TPA: cation diffusion facilitator family transporter [Vicinamibacteria bacterium]|jgi:cation diffusion facilitator family transporter
MAARDGTGTESARVIIAALLGNLLVALTKFAAAAITGSSAMTSEAVHSLVDTGNELLLLYGLRRAAKPADADHPFGHGRELYFWSFIVALAIFAVGALASVFEGVRHIRSPVPIKHAAVNYVVLALALVFEGGAWSIALKQFRAAKGKLGYLEAVRKSKDPTTLTVLAEDTGAILGIFIALAGTVAAQALHRPVLDGAASIAIGVLLGLIAIVLARETKGLLIGEPARSELVSSICAMARAQPGVERSNGLFTVHIGPRQVVAALSVDFTDTLSAGEVETIVATLEDRVKKAHPEVVSVLVKPQKWDRADFKGK